MSHPSRRAFLRTGAVATVATVLPYERLDAQARRTEIGELDDARFRELALRAVDAAKRAGAAYADVRITRTVQLHWIQGPGPRESQSLAAGIRALVNGYWGFASGPYWTHDEMDRLAREAVAQAKVNARGKARTVELGHIPPATGSWTMPIQTDPFSLSWEELDDFWNGWLNEVKQHRDGIIGLVGPLEFRRMEKTCASTEGNLFAQTTYATRGRFTLAVDKEPGSIIDLPWVGAGWEYIQGADVYAAIPRLLEESRQSSLLSGKPVEPGRYPMVFGGRVMGTLLAKTLAPATQLDRALGYEANAGGTSFLNKPLDMLGQTTVASPAVSIIADRTLARGLNTVRWDDEGVVATPFPLVNNGVLVDYQTTREQAAWLTPYYQSRGQAVQSRGCATTDSALDLPMQHTPNLILSPGPDDIGFDDLVAQVPRGFAFVDDVNGEFFSTDFQVRHGSGLGVIREIVNGKLGAVIPNAGVLFDTTELWKNIRTVGGTRSRWLGAGESIKGEPRQTRPFSVSAVPASFKEVALIDVTRRA